MCKSSNKIKYRKILFNEDGKYLMLLVIQLQPMLSGWDI